MNRRGIGGVSTGAGPAAVTLALLAITALPSRASVAAALPQGIQARLSMGHDSNLLDASDSERSSFASGDPKSFFVVSSMRDEFLEAEGRGEWRLPTFLAGRPSLKLACLRRQYLNNPIKSADRFSLDALVRPAPRTRAGIGLDFQPQIYGRHRRNDAALPGEPRFRPEVQRRTDANIELTQGLGQGTSIKTSVQGSVREYRAPFGARDRRLFGGGAAIAQSLPREWRAGLGGGYLRTWSRNDPLVPVDLSNREWALSSWLEARSNRLAAALEIGVELGWRHYTSSDPADVTHFDRDDHLVGVDVVLTRELGGSLASVTRFTGRSRSASIPVGASDEEAFSDSEIETGIRWSQPVAKRTLP